MTDVGVQGYRVIGTRPVRPDGVDKVTGRALYGADVQLGQSLVGRVLRSPHAHARIRSIDTTRAEGLPGVYAVISGRDFPPPVHRIETLIVKPVNVAEWAMNIIAREKVLYRGHAVAAVAAISPAIAEQALDLIAVDYEPLPPVLDVRQAMAPDAPILLDHLRTKALTTTGESPTNIAQHLQAALGDVDAGFAEAEIVLDRAFTTRMVHQGYIEPHNAAAYWSPDGTLTIWTSTQGAFGVREQLAHLLELPIARIKVIPFEIGGGFGGKIPVYLEPVAAVLSRQSGRPVRLTMSRTEVFEGTGPTSGASIRAAIGATRDGRFTAALADLAYEAGAFPGSPVSSAIQTMFGPYAIENVTIDGYDVVVNKPKVASYRAPGSPAAAFAIESLIDELALRLGLDPIDLRLRNAATLGSRNVNGLPVRFPIGNIACLEAARDSAHYRSPTPTSDRLKRRARGVAGGAYFNVGLKTSIAIQLNGDGSVALVEGNPDIGGSRASLAILLAEALAIPYSAVRPVVVDTDSVGYSDITGGSRTTVAGGFAIVEAAASLTQQIVERARRIWHRNAEDVIEYRDGLVVGPNEQLTLPEFASLVHRTGPPIVAHASIVPPTIGGAYAVHIVDLEVDSETGKVEILRYTAVQDVGRAIHPAYVESQIQGGVAQGVGWALNEEYVFDEAGRMENASFLDYRIPTTADLPMIETILVEVPHPGHPFGARGVGEMPIVPPLAAVANAVSRALGHRFTDLPLSPRRILEEAILAEE